jgi:hypothetical protein
MPVGQVSRSTENKSIADFLATAELHPAGMILEGEAGIGKTTQWLAAVEQGRECGFRVLSARVHAARCSPRTSGLLERVDWPVGSDVATQT